MLGRYSKMEIILFLVHNHAVCSQTGLVIRVATLRLKQLSGPSSQAFRLGDHNRRTIEYGIER